MNVAFSVNGEWLTKFIRTRFFYEDVGYTWVVQTIREMFAINGLSEQRIEQIAQDVILGRSYFKGNTGDNTFVYCDGKDDPIGSDFFMKFVGMKEQLKKAEEARKDATEAWKELALVIKGELSRSECECQWNIELLRPTPTEEYIERMIAPEEAVAPYGFISPDGEFHAADFADHERFAGDYMRAHEGWDEVLKNGYHSATDYLVLKKGWLLLHNPRLGKPFLTSGDKSMTKAQREALFDYYTKYGMKQEANALYEEDDR